MEIRQPMMLLIPLIILASYFIGAIPFGLVIVRIKTGKDIRQIESGRTGGTNAMRAAGWSAGILTAILDTSKATVCVWLARWVFPDYYWLHVLAPIVTIIGHNYSIYLVERDEKGWVRLRGGAGGAPCVGGSIGLWFPSLFFIVPLGALLLYFVGYASIATMGIGVISFLIFLYRAWIGVSPWEYIFYGLFAELVLIWALRPNIQRLIQGNERLVGWRARKNKITPP
jgi:glycerol-3-phosphate acyltransferase PlsY